MNILGLDFETSGLDPEVHKVTEVGAVLWNTDINSPVRVEGYLVNHEALVWDPECQRITGITQEVLQQFGLKPSLALKRLLVMVNQADAICAHNGNRFDRAFFRAWCTAENYAEPDLLWIDTQYDLEIPEKASRKLSYMAADHGFLNPFPHRAVFDVMTMLTILFPQQRVQHALDRVLELAASPSIVVESIVPFEEKDRAKERGYHWSKQCRIWWRDLKEIQLEKERAEAPFEVRVINNRPTD